MDQKTRIKERLLSSIVQNLGLINLFGKASGRTLFLILLSFFSYKLSVKDFADFAIFWASLRMFTFYATNNLYIIYFDKVRSFLIEKHEWPKRVSANIIFTGVFFSLVICVISFFLFEDIWVTLIIIPCLLCYIVIRNLTEFAKADNNLFLSIFIEDILFYFLFFIASICGLYFYNDIFMIMIALLFSLFVTAIVCVYLFKRKFKIKISNYVIKTSDFSFSDFKLGLNYTILRGNEVLSNFAVRYLGQIYFGDLFVAYAHIMYQFYNIFCLFTMSVISGFQSKITVKSTHKNTRAHFKKMYKKIIITLSPFILVLFLIILLFNNQILLWFFPKYSEFSSLLIKVSLAGVLFVIVQPFVFILIYNKLFSNIIRLNYIQYFIMLIVFSLPIIIPSFDEQYWLLLIMTIFVLIQGGFAQINYNKIR